MAMSCDIIIPVWNQPAATAACIESVLTKTDHPFRLIIIDNASEDETAVYLDSVKSRCPGSVVVRNGENLGFVKAVNQGMRLSTAPYLCLLNNDTVVTDGWLGRMAAAMDADAGIGILNPSSNTTGQHPLGGESIDLCALRLAAEPRAVQELSRCRGFCMMVRRSVVAAIGYLDEVFGCGYFEETDYSKRALKAGFRIVRLKNAYVHHEEGLSFKAHPARTALFTHNEQIFTERWGRQLRIGYVFTGREPVEQVSALALDVVRAGHQIFVIMEKGRSWPISVDHADIRRIDAPRFLLFLGALLSILRRRSRKKMEYLIFDSVTMSRLFKIMQPLHRAVLFYRPNKDALMARLDADRRRI